VNSYNQLFKDIEGKGEQNMIETIAIRTMSKAYYSEGMIRMVDMKDDFYHLDEENYQVKGQKYGKAYKLGDEVYIQVKSINVQKKQIDFVLLEQE